MATLLLAVAGSALGSAVGGAGLAATIGQAVAASPAVSSTRAGCLPAAPAMSRGRG